MNSSRIAQRLVQFAFLVAVAIGWQVTAATQKVSPLLLPPPISVYHEFATLMSGGQFWPDLSVTIRELLAAFSVASIAGTVVGYAVSRSAYAIKVFDPLLSGLYSIPTIILFPLFVLFFGIGPPSKIAMGATIAFFPIALNTIAGLASVDRGYVTAARSMGASSTQMFWSVMLPAAFPVILTGLRMGLILAFLSILGTETIASFSGLGHRMVALGENMETDKMFAYIVFVMLIAFLLNSLLSFAEGLAHRREVGT